MKLPPRLTPPSGPSLKRRSWRGCCSSCLRGCRRGHSRWAARAGGGGRVLSVSDVVKGRTKGVGQGGGSVSVAPCTLVHNPGTCSMGPCRQMAASRVRPMPRGVALRACLHAYPRPLPVTRATPALPDMAQHHQSLCIPFYPGHVRAWVKGVPVGARVHDHLAFP